MFGANVLRVMIASPGDVADLRSIVTEELHRWNDANASARNLVLLPVKWETHSTPQMGAHPQAIIDRQLLTDADIVIGIFGTRIGTPTEEFVSGTVQEIKKHVAAGKTAKLYFSDVPVSPSTVNASQYAALQEFREECQSTGLYATFKSLEQFRVDFSHHLNLELNQPRYRWLTRPDFSEEPDEPQLSEDALELLTAAAASRDGVVILSESLDGSGAVVTGTSQFPANDPRSMARWRAAIEELIAIDALSSSDKDVYRLTKIGYDIEEEKNSKAGEPKRESAFDEHRRAHLRDLLEPLNYMQRDLLRFLLLQSGAARLDVIIRAKTSSSAAIDVSKLGQPLTEKGLIEMQEDRMNGYRTYRVSEGMRDGLQHLLFPRIEGDNMPFLSGILPTQKQ